MQAEIPKVIDNKVRDPKVDNDEDSQSTIKQVVSKHEDNLR